MLLLLALLAVVLAQSGHVPFDQGGKPEPKREYRTLCGYGNNKANPTWGQVFTPYTTVQQIYFPSNSMEGLNATRINERMISVLCSKASDGGRTLVDNFVNQLHTEWGHFLVTDIANTPDAFYTPGTAGIARPPPGYPNNYTWPPPNIASPVVYIPVLTNVGDWDIDTEKWVMPNAPPSQPPYYLRINRYQNFPGTGANTTQPKKVFNTCSHFMDGSSVYGTNDIATSSIWNPETGLLFIDAPWSTATDPIAAGIEPRATGKWRQSGDSRFNKHPGLRALILVFQLEHNRLVKEMRAANPHWSAKVLFQEARRLVIAFIQNLSIREYLAATTGNPLPVYTGYNPNVNPTLDVLFVTTIMRYGHTEVRSELQRLEADGQTPCAGGHVLIRDVIFLPGHWEATNASGHHEINIPCFIRGFALTLSAKVDIGFVDDVRNFFLGGGRHGSDLMVMSLFRRHDVGLPDYNTIRTAYFGLARKNNVAEISSDPRVQQVLTTLYGGNMDIIDPFVGMNAEDHVKGAMVGELCRTALQSTFGRLRDGDRFWFENTDYFTEEEIAMVHGTKFSDLLSRNFGMAKTETPTSPFFVTKRQLDRPVTGDDLFLFPPLFPHERRGDGYSWYTQFLAPFYQLSWIVERDVSPQKITFQIQTASVGWVGLGFNPQPNTMKGADIILCRRRDDNGAPECRDSKAFNVGEPALDTVSGGTNDIDLIHYEESNGFTTAVFSRNLNTEDDLDWEITDGTQVIFAFNPTTNELRYHGPTRQSKITIDFLRLYKAPPQQVYINKGITVWLYIMAAIGILEALFIITLIIVKRPYFHYQSPEFCILICCGAILSHIATILILVPNPTDGMCWAQLWLFGMGFWFVFMCLFTKVLRIWWMVQSTEKKMRSVKVPLEMLLIPLAAACVLEGVFNACWDGIYEVRPNVDRYNNTETNEYTLYCGGNMYMWLGSVLVRAMFLLFGIWVALETRGMQKSLNWSREVALAIYTMGLFCFVLIPLGFAISNSPVLVIILKGIGFSISYILILLIIFFDSIKRIFKNKPPRQFESSAVLSNTSGSMTGGSGSHDEPISVPIRGKN